MKSLLKSLKSLPPDNQVMRRRSQIISNLGWHSLGFALTPIILCAGKASADIAVNQEFNPISVSVNQASTLTIQLFNANPGAATGTSFTNNLPSGLVIATPTNITNSCGGTITANAGSSSISLANGTISGVNSGILGTCTITVNVKSSTPGTYVNTIPAGVINSSQGSNPLPANATLTVAPNAPVTGNKTFSPSNLHGNGAATTMTITLNNPNVFPLTNASFTDNLPTGLKVATIPNASTTCGSGVVTGVAGGNTVSFSGGIIPANASCIVKVNLEASNPNTFQDGNVTNTIAANNLTTREGITNTSPIQGLIRVQKGAQVAKAFAPASIQTGQTSVFTLTLRNFNTTPITSANITDNMPAGVTVTGLVSHTCNGTVTFTATSIQLTDGTIPAAPTATGSGSCDIKVNVTANTAGSYQNTIPAGNFNGVNYNSANATLTVNLQTPVSISKNFSPTGRVQGGQSTLTITLTNIGNTPGNITSFTDDLTTMGTGITIASSPTATTTCGGTVNATPGATIITKTDGAIPAQGSCIITVPIQIASNAVTGNRTNTIQINGLQTNLGNNTTTATANLTINRALSVSKAFSPNIVPISGVTRLTITVTRNSGAPELTGIQLTDNLPGGHTINSTPNLTNTCGGTVTAPPNGTAINLTNGIVPVGSGNTTCQISLDILAPSTPGTATNTIPKDSVTSAQGATNGSNANADLTRIASFLTLNTAFTPTSISLGGSSKLTILISNNNPSAINLTGVALTNIFPLGMIATNTPNATFTGSGCSGGTISANPGGNQISLSGASINANAVCTLSVNVTSNFVGNLTNELPASLVTSTQGVTNNNAPSATLTLLGLADLQLVSKDDGVTIVSPGGTTTYTILVQNSGPNNVSGISVKDTAPPSMTFLSWNCTASPGSTCDETSGTGNINTSVSLLNNGTATFTVNAKIDPNATGTITNIAEVSAPPTVTDPHPHNNTYQDTDTVIATHPNVLLVKRITAVNGTTTTNGGDNLSNYINEVANPYDDNTIEPNLAPKLPNYPTADTDKWPDRDNSGTPDEFLIGGINGGSVNPGDELEYTIYFISTGDAPAHNVLFCDRVPENVTFIPTAFNSNPPQASGGLPNSDRGITLNFGGSSLSLTNIADGDNAQYFAPGIEPTTVFPNLNCHGSNSHGAVVVNLGTLPNATAPGTPTNSYGFVRFRGRVK